MKKERAVDICKNVNSFPQHFIKYLVYLCTLTKTRNNWKHAHVVTFKHTKCLQVLWKDLQMRQTSSLKNSASISEVTAGVGWHLPLHVFIHIHHHSFLLLQGFFFPNKTQSERILEANIHSFVWSWVKQKKRRLGCVCERVWVCCGSLLTADAELMW